ncbi:hypothetical protein BH10ACI1_BH10ACI1_26510 [soil metagenome]
MNRIRKLKLSVIITLITFIMGISAWFFYTSSIFQKPHLELPDGKWEKTFFKGIDEVTESAGLEKLREKNLHKKDIEIRVWRGFGLGPLEGMIFNQTDNQWAVYYLSQDEKSELTKANVNQLLRNPKSGWDSFIKQIYDAGILELPDLDAINCDVSTIDGMSYVVEIYKDKVYRTYRYNSLSEKKCNEGKQMNEIAKIIAKEFYDGTQKCKRAEWLPCLSRYSE